MCFQRCMWGSPASIYSSWDRGLLFCLRVALSSFLKLQLSSKHPLHIPKQSLAFHPEVLQSCSDWISAHFRQKNRWPLGEIWVLFDINLTCSAANYAVVSLPLWVVPQQVVLQEERRAGRDLWGPKGGCCVSWQIWGTGEGKLGTYLHMPIT